MPAQSRLPRVQAISGLIFGFFLVLHLLTTISVLGGTASYDETLRAIRVVYRPILLVELALIGASGFVHIGCALVSMRRRKKVIALAGPFWLRAHRASGYFLLLVAIGHALATRVLPVLATEGPADFAFLAFSLLKAPYFFVPYYILLGASGATHLGIGVHLASRNVRGLPVSAPSRADLAVVGALTVLVVASVLTIIIRAPEANRDNFEALERLYQRAVPRS